MGTAELKLNLHKLIDGVQDNSILEAVYTLLSKANVNTEDDWYNSLPDEIKASIERGISEADNKQYVPYTEVKAKVNKLFGRTT